jgi:hypothetical protein
VHLDVVPQHDRCSGSDGMRLSVMRVGELAPSELDMDSRATLQPIRHAANISRLGRGEGTTRSRAVANRVERVTRS